MTQGTDCLAFKIGTIDSTVFCKPLAGTKMELSLGFVGQGESSIKLLKMNGGVSKKVKDKHFYTSWALFPNLNSECTFCWVSDPFRDGNFNESRTIFREVWRTVHTLGC